MLVTVLMTKSFPLLAQHFLTRIKEQDFTFYLKKKQQEIKYAMPVKVNILKIRGLWFSGQTVLLLQLFSKDLGLKPGSICQGFQSPLSPRPRPYTRRYYWPLGGIGDRLSAHRQVIHRGLWTRKGLRHKERTPGDPWHQAELKRWVLSEGGLISK